MQSWSPTKAWQQTPISSFPGEAKYGSFPLPDDWVTWFSTVQSCSQLHLVPSLLWRNLRGDVTSPLLLPAFSSVQFSRSVMSDSLQPHEQQQARPPYPSQTPVVYSNSCPSSQWCHPAISSSVIPFSSCPQSLPASGSFPWVNSSNEVAKVLEFQLQHQSFQWTPRTYILSDGLVGSPWSPRDSQESSPTP